jgi:hypothetical protein
MRAKRTDTNHAEIRDALRDIPGVQVADTSGVGEGYPDITVGYLGRNFLFEIKYKNGKLTDKQEIFHAGWTGDVRIVRSIDDALDAMGVR